ncbi:MAG: hypothetical protein IKK47_04930 [Ruminococcus sp.]|nr:hypothetical protein [Ruminococcus sp.]
MKRFSNILFAVLSAGLLISLSSCKSQEEKKKNDADNKKKAIGIAEEYFGESYKYDFDFYGGGGEGDASADIYVFTDGKTFNCVSVPTKENAPDSRVYYDCDLHQFESGRWQLQDWENSEKVK